ncbi:hypothetical protein IFR05_014344 [Cadophora sp. M221]|nr:hypothetical protein IFR05_014344 [Cadophora sp. M221]
MSNKNKSKKSSTKSQHAEEVRRKIVKNDSTKVEVIAERKSEVPESTPKPAPASTPVQTRPEVPVAKPRIEESAWSDWAWDDLSGRWWRARLAIDKTWQYEYAEPTESVLVPSPVPQFAPAAKYQYPEQKSGMLFANEVTYQLPDPRGGYFLAVGQEEQSWNVEDVLNSTKAKEGPKKVHAVAEKKEGGGEKKIAAPGGEAPSQKPAAAEKAPAKANVNAQPALTKEVSESSSTKKTKAESGHAPSPLSEKEKKSKQPSKSKKKTVYIENDEDEDDEPRHRGRTRERRR